MSQFLLITSPGPHCLWFHYRNQKKENQCCLFQLTSLDSTGWMPIILSIHSSLPALNCLMLSLSTASSKSLHYNAGARTVSCGTALDSFSQLALSHRWLYTLATQPPQKNCHVSSQRWPLLSDTQLAESWGQNNDLTCATAVSLAFLWVIWQGPAPCLLTTVLGDQGF